jgi:hypothetical protein
MNIEFETDKAPIGAAEQNVVWLDATCQVPKFKIMIVISKR